MKPYLENIVMPDDRFPIRAFISTAMEHVITVHPHWHTAVEILYYLEGSALQQVNDRYFTAGPGNIVIIGKDQLHSTYTVGRSNCRILVLQFDADSLLGPCGNAPKLPTQFDCDIVYRNPINSLDAGAATQQCIDELFSELTEKRPAYEQMARSAVFRLAGLLRRSGLYDVASIAAKDVKDIQAMLEKTFRLVDESFADEITLEAAAAASSLSTAHFCRLFRRATGMTFHEYLNFYRVNRAAKLLDGRRKLAETAFACGFGSVTSFIRNFWKYKNCAPSRYNHTEGSAEAYDIN